MLAASAAAIANELTDAEYRKLLQHARTVGIRTAAISGDILQHITVLLRMQQLQMPIKLMLNYTELAVSVTIP